MQITRLIALSMLSIMLLGNNCNSMDYYENVGQNNQIKPEDICNKKLVLSYRKKSNKDIQVNFYTEPKQNSKIDVNRMWKGQDNYKVQLVEDHGKFTHEFMEIQEDMQAVCDGIKKYYCKNDKHILSLSDDFIKNNTELGIIEYNGKYCLGFYTKLLGKSMLTYISGNATISYIVQDISPNNNVQQNMLQNIKDIQQYLKRPVNFVVDDDQIGIENEIVTCYSTPIEFFYGKSSNGTSFEVNRVLAGGKQARTENVNNKVKITIRDNKFTIDDKTANKHNKNIGVILYNGKLYLGLYSTEYNIEYDEINNEKHTDGNKTCWDCLDDGDDECIIGSQNENDLFKSTILLKKDY